MHNEHIAEAHVDLACYARDIGVSHIVSVFDVAVEERFLKSMGQHAKDLGAPQQVGNTRAVAGMLSSDISQVRKVAQTWGFDLDTLVKYPHELNLREAEKPLALAA